MRDLGQRLLIGLAAAAAGVMAIGYAFIFGGIATPVRSDRATVDVPAAGQTTAAVLDDGRPVFVVNDPVTGIAVLDAGNRQPASTVGALVAWCPQTRTFTDPASGSVYAPNGELISGPATDGLVAFTTRPVSVDKTSEVIVVFDTSIQGRSSTTERPRPDACDGDAWVVHEARANETFDPSVAADQEPPGWIWLEGTVRTVEGEVRLCDGRSNGCEAYAATVGIDPASVSASSTSGRFIGRVRDNAIEGLTLVPDLAEAP